MSLVLAALDTASPNDVQAPGPLQLGQPTQDPSAPALDGDD
jgi:hypothetical protein